MKSNYYWYGLDDELWVELSPVGFDLKTGEDWECEDGFESMFKYWRRNEE